MKIAIVRGPSLNPWEMQNYLPLAKNHRLLLVGSKMGRCEFTSEVKTERLLCLGEIFNFIPKGIEFLYRFFGDPQILWGLQKTVAGYDIVHTAECVNYYTFQALKARHKGLVKKLVVTCWENIPRIHENYPAQRRIKKEIAREADHFLAVTEGTKQSLIADGVLPGKITVIPMGVDLEKFRVQSSEFRVQNKKKFEILFVGRLVEEKGVRELLEAFKVVCEQTGSSVDFRLRMVGNGPLRDSLAQQAQEWGILEKVIIEEKKYDEIPEVYQKADLFVLPSLPQKTWQEQFGMVLVEAMACGVPVVATKTGAISEVIGEVGILVEPGNTAQLAAEIAKLLSNGELRVHASIRGLKRVRALYDCQKVALKIEKLYQKILRG